MQNRAIVLLLIFLTSVVLGRSKADITEKELRDHVLFLASDSLKGRKPGTPEDIMAAEYIRSQIALPQVKFPTENGLQYFEVLTALELGAENALSVSDSSYILDKDYYPHSISENGYIDAEVVVAGYGFNIESDSLTWRDYDGLNAAGKWVMILRGDPEPDQLDSPFARYADLRTKALVAKDAGAAGVLLVSGKIFDEKDDFAELLINEGHISAGLPVIQLKKTVADRLLAVHGLSVDSLEILLNESRSPHSLRLNERIKGSVDILRIKSRTQNVAALLPGDDPSLADEIVVLGAHYDHLGFGGPGSGSRRPDTSAIHNGADDNASGVAVAMEIFEKLATAKKRHRSLLFIAFGAEEMGSLGAKYFIQNPLIDLKKIVFMCNLDMVGRLDSILTLYGTGTAVGMEPLL
ncbi:MAG: M20/M25/M40 family metallo-hydrolase, partial [Calditrichaeota bacterium]